MENKPMVTQGEVVGGWVKRVRVQEDTSHDERWAMPAITKSLCYTAEMNITLYIN